MQCSLARGLELIGEWWSLLIIRDLFLDVRRFDELVEDLGISRNLLARRLKGLMTSGIVERRAYQKRPLRYTYHLSEAGTDLIPAVLALTAWGDRWAAPKKGSAIEFIHNTCGHRFEPRIVCSTCDQPIRADDVQGAAGPGGAAAPGTMVLARKLRPTTQSKRGRDI